MEENNDQEHIQNLLLIDFKRKINKHSINYDDIENKIVSDFKDKSKLSENEIMDVLFFIVYPFIIKKNSKTYNKNDEYELSKKVE